MLNWIARYAPAVAALPASQGLQGAGSVLDVGAASVGLACVAPDVPFVAVDVFYASSVAPSMLALQTDGQGLPFLDQAFETVICLDTLEHLPAPERAGLVSELARVCAGTVVVGCPSRESATMDEVFRQMYVQRGMPVPDWVDEHQEQGLPTVDEVETWVRAVPGFAAASVPGTNALITTLAAFADVYPELAPVAAVEARERTPEWERLFAAASFGPSLRPMWLLRREPPGEASVRSGNIAGTLPAALRCPRCGTAFAWVGDDLLRCTGCGAQAPRDPATGAWALDAIARS